MRFRIYGEDENGNEDSVVVSGDTLDEVIAAAHHEEAKRNWKNCWSEELDAQRRVNRLRATESFAEGVIVDKTKKIVNDPAGAESALNVGLERDAERYRKIRRLAINRIDLESQVALEQLDYAETNDSFDEIVDAF